MIICLTKIFCDTSSKQDGQTVAGKIILLSNLMPYLFRSPMETGQVREAATHQTWLFFSRNVKDEHLRLLYSLLHLRGRGYFLQATAFAIPIYYLLISQSQINEAPNIVAALTLHRGDGFYRKTDPLLLTLPTCPPCPST